MDWLLSREPCRSRTFGSDELRMFGYDGIALPLLDRHRGLRYAAPSAQQQSQDSI